MSNFSAVNYALSKKLDNAILSGVVSHSVDNVNKTITFTFSNGTSSTLQFNNPTNGVDGVGIATMYKDSNNHLIVTLSDGSNIDVGELPVGNATGIIKEITNITYLDSKLSFSFSDGTKKIVTVNPKLSELSDVSISSATSGQVLVYNGATNKFINSSISTTDQYVKMTNADATGSYLADLIDNDTLVNNNNKLEVNKIKGQQITVDELNTLIGMDANVKDSLNALATGGMVFKDVVPTKADLPQGALNGFVYIVNSDESDNGNRNAYIYSDDHGDYVLVGTSGLEVRDFTTNPINLESEVTGILPSSKIDSTGLVNKATDVVSSLTYPIPDSDLNKIANLNVLKQINTEVANALNNKLDKSAITTTLDNTATDDKVPSAKAVYNNSKNKINEVLINGDIISYADSITSETVTDTVRIKNGTNSPYGTDNTDNDFHYTIYNIADDRFKRIVAYDIRKNDMYMNMKNVDIWSKWQQVCSSTVADVQETILPLNSWVSGNVYYTVKNGICFVMVNGLKSDTMSTNSQTIVSGLPKPMCNNVWYSISANSGEYGSLLVHLSDGKLTNYIGSDNVPYYGTFSYPVAE